MNFSTRSRQTSSPNCSGGDFMKYEDAEVIGPPMPPPAELGEPQTSSLYSRLSGTSPKPRPSSRTKASLRSSSQGTWSDGPMCTSAPAISCGILEVTDWVFEIFLDLSRVRS